MPSRSPSPPSISGEALAQLRSGGFRTAGLACATEDESESEDDSFVSVPPCIFFAEWHGAPCDADTSRRSATACALIDV